MKFLPLAALFKTLTNTHCAIPDLVPRKGMLHNSSASLAQIHHRESHHNSLSINIRITVCPNCRLQLLCLSWSTQHNHILYYNNHGLTKMASSELICMPRTCKWYYTISQSAKTDKGAVRTSSNADPTSCYQQRASNQGSTASLQASKE